MALGHPLGPQQRLTSVFVPFHRVLPPILFNLALLLVTSLALGLLRGECTDHAPKGNTMAQVTFATAFGHPLGPQQRLTSVFVPYRRVVPPILFDLAFVSGFASFGGLLRGECTDQAPKGEAVARGTFATAFGHPLGVQQRLTSAFVPYCGAVSPILFDLAFVSDFASFGAVERQMR